jgi:cytochrome c biogenesis factor
MVIASETRAKTRSRNIVLGSCLFLASLAALVLALFPTYVIRPFREQKPAALQHALWVMLHDKPILIGLFLLIAICALVAWRRTGWISRLLLLAPAMAIALIAAVVAWVNPYEQMMFHPYGEPRYATIQKAGIDAKDMVIAVTLGGESRAYPIREMGYHHVVNDRLHQLPIVVTY